jgi:hypothetical protein
MLQRELHLCVQDEVNQAGMWVSYKEGGDQQEMEKTETMKKGIFMEDPKTATVSEDSYTNSITCMREM